MFDPESIYPNLRFPDPPADRPTIVMNMVATIDGKTVSGTRMETVMDLGSPLDHAVMRAIEGRVDAVLTAAGTLRATPGAHYPEDLIRIVATRSGNLDYSVRFFTDPGQVFVACPEGTGAPCPSLPADPVHLVRRLRDMQVKTLLIEGGSELNASYLELDLVDELFLTIAPLIKLGRETPTYAGGTPLERGSLPRFELVSCQPIGDEVFLRYRRKRQ